MHTFEDLWKFKHGWKNVLLIYQRKLKTGEWGWADIDKVCQKVGIRVM